MRWAIAVCLLTSAAACSPEFGSGDFLCDDAAERGCPEGFDCVGGRCVTSGAADSGVMDGRMDTGGRPDGGEDAALDSEQRDGTMDTSVEDGSVDAGADASVCPREVIHESATIGGGAPGDRVFGNDLYFWRFEVTEPFTATTVGASFSESDDAASMTFALVPLDRSDDVPDQFLTGEPLTAIVAPAAITAPTDVSVSLSGTLTARWWAIAVRSNVAGSPVRLSHRHTPTGGQDVFLNAGAGPSSLPGRRLFVRGCLEE